MSQESVEHIHTGDGPYIAGDVYTGGGDFIAGDKYDIHMPQRRKDAQERRNQLILLGKVHKFWINGVLAKSLHNEVLIELGKESHPELIAHPWEMVVDYQDHKTETLHAGSKIGEIFENVGRSLLVLGEPGSGKTITLLELARDLIDKAVKDPLQPIPVVLNLSSWGQNRTSFSAWVLAELKSKYQVPEEMSRRWLRSWDLLLLLDGLDEVQTDHRATCITAINEFGSGHGLSGIVVCSRVTEYKSTGVQFSFGGALLLQPLSFDQVNQYLTNTGGHLIDILNADPGLYELAATPLMLNVMSMAFQDDFPGFGKIEDFSLKNYRQLIFDAYIRRMIRRRGKLVNYQAGEIITWLANLANGLQKHHHSIFLIEEIQPIWLEKTSLRKSYTLLSRAIFGLFLGALFLGGSWINLIFLLIAGTLLGLIAGIGDYIRLSHFNNLGQKTEKRQTIWYSFLLGITGAMIFGFLFGTLGGNEAFEVVSNTLSGMILGGFAVGIVLGKRIQPLGYWVDIQIVTKLKWSWQQAGNGARRGLVYAFLSSIIAGIFSALVLGVINLLKQGESIEEFGLILLGIGAAGFFSGLIYAIFFSLGGMLIGSIFGGLRSFTLTEQTHQGVWLSARNAIYAALIITIPVGLIGILLGGYDYAVQWVMRSIIIAILWYGGIDVIKHFCVRLLLWQSRQFPWELTKFLDCAVDLIFLRKVGRGYIFIHRIVMEHFATLNANDTKRLLRK